MLLQSHEGELSLLPALPASWAEGEVHGLRARGGYEVGLAWGNGALREATVASTRGGTCRVRAAASLRVRSGGKEVAASHPGPHLTEFRTEPGAVYELAPR